MGTVGFEPVEGVARVEVNVQELDEPVVLEQGKVFETGHPAVIAALDENGLAQRAGAGRRKGGES